MKLYYFLVTFVLANATIDEEADCKKEILLTNIAMQRAYETVVGEYGENGLEHVIKQIVSSTSHLRKSFAKINYMIAAPDKLKIIDYIPEYKGLSLLTKCSHYQYAMQDEIIRTTKIDVHVPLANVDEDFAALDLNVLASQRRVLVAEVLKNIFKQRLGDMYNNFMLELELELVIRDPETDQVQDLRDKNLTTLVEERRRTGTSMENTFKHILGRNIPEVSEDQRESSVVDDYLLGHSYLYDTCRLLGLYITTQFPSSYINEIWTIPDDETCILIYGRQQKIYRRVLGVWKRIARLNTSSTSSDNNQ